MEIGAVSPGAARLAAPTVAGLLGGLQRWSALGGEPSASGNHRLWAVVDGLDDLCVIDPPQIS
jgi:hypothetical protein